MSLYTSSSKCQTSYR